MSVDMAASAPDLVAALIEELGGVVTAAQDDTNPADTEARALRCMSIAFAIQSKVATATDVIRENT